MGPGLWSAGDATKNINRCAQDDALALSWTVHVRDQMADRDLATGDIRHVLKRGFVLDPPRPATRPGYFKYLIESTTPNSDGRKVGVVVIPDGGAHMKLVTVMWRDEL